MRFRAIHLVLSIDGVLYITSVAIDGGRVAQDGDSLRGGTKS